MPESSEKMFALFFVDETGVEWFAGRFKNREDAEARAKTAGKKYSIKEVAVT